MARLTDKQREDIKNALLLGDSQYKVAQDFEVSSATVNKIFKELDEQLRAKYINKSSRPFKDKKDGYVYVIYFRDTSLKTFFKIGLATDIRNRINQHRTSSPFKVYIAISYYSEDMRKEEKELHDYFKQKRLLGEWLDLSREDLEYIRNRSLRVEYGD